MGHPSELWERWWHRPDRASVVTIGVALLAVPTVFAVFAETDRWSLWVRGPIGGAWLVVAVVAVVRQHVHDRGVDQLVEDWRRERIDEELFAAVELLTAYLQPGMKGTPESFRWYVHAYDQERKLLLPIIPQSVDVGDPQVFRPGDGVVGTAFVRRRVVVVSGDAVADDSYGLSPAQRDYFASYRRVVAAPLEWAGNVLGTLSAISVQDDDYFETDHGPAVLRDVAGVVAAVMAMMVGGGGIGR